jgi:hypothetical protein
MKFRLLGVLFLIGGLAAGWFWGLGPLREAQAHAPIVKYSMKTFMVVPLSIVIGLLLIGWGERVWALVNGAPENPRILAYRIVMIAVVGLIAWGSWTWFDGQMTALGYGEIR